MLFTLPPFAVNSLPALCFIKSRKGMEKKGAIRDFFHGAPDNKADRPANSRERWAGALMEVRSLFLLIVTYGRTDIQTDRHSGL